MNKIRIRFKNIFRKEDGQAIVEFALIAPIFITFLLAMLQIGVIMNYENGVLSAAREGARWGAITGDINGNSTRKDDIEGEVKDKVRKYIEMLQWQEDPEIKIKFPDNEIKPKGGERVEVKVSYPLDPFFPIPTNLLGGSGNLLPNTLTISHTVTAVLEDV